MANTIQQSGSHSLSGIQTKIAKESFRVLGFPEVAEKVKCRSLQRNNSRRNAVGVTVESQGARRALVIHAFTEQQSESTHNSSSETGAAEFDVLREHLEAGEWRKADEETRRLLIVFAGEAAVKRKYVFFSEVRFILAQDLQAIDDLWTKHSNGRFGYSVQKQIWNKSRKDFTEFFKKVGWMKKLDSEIEQFTYRSFPSEFMWELNDTTPEGHLPLTNALRGTQLLASILQHPAFAFVDEQLKNKDGVSQKEQLNNRGPAFGMKSFVPNYKF